MPKRIQRSRAAGWRMPEGAVIVDRSTRYGNPYVVWNDYGQWMVSRGGEHHLAASKSAAFSLSVDLFAAMVCDAKASSRLDAYPHPTDIMKALSGKDLACWCHLCATHADGKPFGIKCAACAPCHSDVLGAIANSFNCEAINV